MPGVQGRAKRGVGANPAPESANILIAWPLRYGDNTDSTLWLFDVVVP